MGLFHERDHSGKEKLLHYIQLFKSMPLDQCHGTSQLIINTLFAIKKILDPIKLRQVLSLNLTIGMCMYNVHKCVGTYLYVCGMCEGYQR